MAACQTSSNANSQYMPAIPSLGHLDNCRCNSSGHMKEALLYIVNGAEHYAKYGPGVWRGAQLIYRAMEVKGTNDKQLVWRYAELF